MRKHINSMLRDWLTGGTEPDCIRTCTLLIADGKWVVRLNDDVNHEVEYESGDPSEAISEAIALHERQEPRT